jgi:hypothetical protein
MQYLVELGRENATKGIDPKEAIIHGEKYIVTGSKLERFQPKQPRFSDIFSAYSLQGLVDFLKTDVDQYFTDSRKNESCGSTLTKEGPTSFDRFIVRVTSPTRVEVFTPVFGPDRIRSCIAFCEVDLPGISFDKYIAAEDLLIMLNTRFDDDIVGDGAVSNRTLAMQLVGNMRNEQSNQTADDGFSQRVTVKTGVAEAQDVKIENPIYLVPKRTFHEVPQPGSPFVLRFKAEEKATYAALFESDGGAWKYAAVKNIAAWLKTQLKDIESPVNVEIIA